MLIKPAEDFKIIKGTDGVETFYFESERIDDCMKYIRRNRLTRILITGGWYKRKDLDFLTDLADFLEGIVILPDKIELKLVNKLKMLTSLGVGDNGRDTIDLANFPKLESAAVKWGRRLTGLESCRNLKSLTINGYNPTKKNMTEFPDLPSLEELWIFKGNLQSLEGIGRLPLKFLWLYSLPKLVSISAVTSLSESLRKLQIESCRQVTDFESLRSMRALEKLMISQCGPIPSIDFIKEISSLFFFSFSGTNILDGDLSPLEGLKYAGFDDKRHYSRKWKDFNWEKIPWDD